MIVNHSITMFSKQYERKTKNGGTFTRLESYNDLKTIVDKLNDSIKSGHTLLKILPRIYFILAD